MGARAHTLPKNGIIQIFFKTHFTAVLSALPESLLYKIGAGGWGGEIVALHLLIGLRAEHKYVEDESPVCEERGKEAVLAC